MPTLNIEGRRVKVDDGFLALSPEQQNATVEEIAQTLGITKSAAPSPKQSDISTATAVGRGAAQGLTLGLNDEMRGLVEAGGTAPDQPASLGALVRGGVNLLTGSGQEAYRAGTDRTRKDLAAAHEQAPIATGAGEIGGALAGGLGLAGAGLSFGANAARAGHGLGRAALGSAVDGSILGAVQGAGSAQEGERLGGAGSGALAGTLIGGAAPIAVASASNLVRRAVTPFQIGAERQALANTLRQEGVDLSAGQITGSKGLRYAESEIGGSTAENLMERQGEQFTAAALRRAGENANRATPTIMDRAFTRIGRNFDDLAARNWAEFDGPFVRDLQRVSGEYNSLVPQSQRAPVVDNILQDIINTHQANNGVMTGDAYQALRSRLDRLGRAAKNDSQLSEALFGIRNALDDVTERTIAMRNPNDLGEWRNARREYRNMLVLEKAVTGAGSDTAEGLISPSQLRNATVQQNRRSYARGHGDFAELARAGEALMKPLPQSGTAPRLRAQQLAAVLGGSAGAGAAGPAGAALGVVASTALPRAVGAAMMSRPGQAYLTNQLLGGQASPQYRALASLLLTNSAIAARD